MSKRHPLSSRSGGRMMSGKEGRVVRMEGWTSISELELAVGRREIRKTWRRSVFHSARRQVHRESAHFPRPAEERPAAHRRQLLQPTFFGAFVLEPNLETNRKICQNRWKPARKSGIIDNCCLSPFHGIAVRQRFARTMSQHNATQYRTVM